MYVPEIMLRRLPLAASQVRKLVVSMLTLIFETFQLQPNNVVDNTYVCVRIWLKQTEDQAAAYSHYSITMDEKFSCAQSVNKCYS